MQDTDLIQKPKWNHVGEDWHMLIGNKSVARLFR